MSEEKLVIETEAEEVFENIKISACMIVRDEAYPVDGGTTCIQRCLDSLKDKVDEIIIVDNGSDDATEYLCKQYTEHFYKSKKYQGDNFVFSGARNESIEYATGTHILIIDADEQLLLADKNVLRRLVKDNPDRCFEFQVLDIIGAEGTKSVTNNRLFPKGRVHYSGDVHNQPIGDDDTIVTQFDMWIHYGYAPTEKRKKRNAQSRAILLKTIENEKVNSMLAYYMYQLGVTYYGERDYKEAKRCFKEALRRYDVNEDVIAQETAARERERQAELGITEPFYLLVTGRDLYYMPVQAVGYLHMMACEEKDEFHMQMWTKRITRYQKHFRDIYFYNARYYYCQENYLQAKKWYELYLKHYAHNDMKHIHSYSLNMVMTGIADLVRCIEKI